MDELVTDKGKQPMEDIDEKFDFNTDEDDHVASVKCDSDYEGIFAAFIHVFEVLWWFIYLRCYIASVI